MLGSLNSCPLHLCLVDHHECNCIIDKLLTSMMFMVHYLWFLRCCYCDKNVNTKKKDKVNKIIRIIIIKTKYCPCHRYKILKCEFGFDHVSILWIPVWREGRAKDPYKSLKSQKVLQFCSKTSDFFPRNKRYVTNRLISSGGMQEGWWRTSLHYFVVLFRSLKNPGNFLLKKSMNPGVKRGPSLYIQHYR